jgi:hypothetical protein
MRSSQLLSGLGREENGMPVTPLEDRNHNRVPPASALERRHQPTDEGAAEQGVVDRIEKEGSIPGDISQPSSK